MKDEDLLVWDWISSYTDNSVISGKVIDKIARSCISEILVNKNERRVNDHLLRITLLIERVNEHRGLKGLSPWSEKVLSDINLLLNSYYHHTISKVSTALVHGSIGFEHDTIDVDRTGLYADIDRCMKNRNWDMNESSISEIAGLDWPDTAKDSINSMISFGTWLNQRYDDETSSNFSKMVSVLITRKKSIVNTGDRIHRKFSRAGLEELIKSNGATRRDLMEEYFSSDERGIISEIKLKDRGTHTSTSRYNTVVINTFLLPFFMLLYGAQKTINTLKYRGKSKGNHCVDILRSMSALCDGIHNGLKCFSYLDGYDLDYSPMTSLRGIIDPGYASNEGDLIIPNISNIHGSSLLLSNFTSPKDTASPFEIMRRCKTEDFMTGFYLLHPEANDWVVIEDDTVVPKDDTEQLKNALTETSSLMKDHDFRRDLIVSLVQNLLTENPACIYGASNRLGCRLTKDKKFVFSVK